MFICSSIVFKADRSVLKGGHFFSSKLLKLMTALTKKKWVLTTYLVLGIIKFIAPSACLVLTVPSLATLNNV